MKNHTKVYLEHFGFDVGDFIPCEITGNMAVDVHHITARGMGGRPKNSMDTPENLMALARKWHNFIEMNPSYYWWFHLVHCQYMVTKKPYHQTLASMDDPFFKEISENILR